MNTSYVLNEWNKKENTHASDFVDLVEARVI